MLCVATSKVRAALLAAVGAVSITAAGGAPAHAAAGTLRAPLAVPAAARPKPPGALAPAQTPRQSPFPPARAGARESPPYPRPRRAPRPRPVARQS